MFEHVSKPYMKDEISGMASSLVLFSQVILVLRMVHVSFKTCCVVGYLA